MTPEKNGIWSQGYFRDAAATLSTVAVTGEGPEVCSILRSRLRIAAVPRSGLCGCPIKGTVFGFGFKSIQKGSQTHSGASCLWL